MLLPKAQSGAIVLILIGSLAGCATPYQPEGFTGGFSEIPLATDAYKINVRGNGFTSHNRVQEMALLRGAELAQLNGYAHFLLMDMASYERTSQYTTPGSSSTTTTGSATAYGYGNTVNIHGTSSSRTTYNPGQTHYTVKPGVDIVVKFINEKTASEAGALSVHQIFEMYADKYGLAR